MEQNLPPKSNFDVDAFLASLNDQERKRLVLAIRTFTEWLLSWQAAKKQSSQSEQESNTSDGQPSV